jgi:single-strand DNA-binding protein
MRGFNKVILAGNLTRDPQLKYLPSQMAVVEFGLAMNRKWRTAEGQDREEVCFVDCSAFGKTGEVINQYCTKGKPLLVEGRLKLDQWEDKQGGGKRSRLTVVVENFTLLSAGPGDGGGQGGGYDEGGGGPPQARPPVNRPPAARPAPQNQAPARPAPEQPFGDEQQFKEDDIPF